MFYIFILSILILQISCVIKEIPDSICLRSICKLETNCSIPLNLTAPQDSCDYDSQNREVCGYFRLNEYMYTHCYYNGREKSESIYDAFHRCANNYTCASQCVEKVPNKGKHKCYGISKCQMIAMAHFGGGGPYACRFKTPERMEYWRKVEQISKEYLKNFTVLRQFFE